MIVLGLDPGTLKMGWALVESVHPNRLVKLRSGVLKPRRADSLEQRMGAIWKALQQIADYPQREEDCALDTIAVEGGFFGHNAQGALKIGMARGQAYTLAGDKEVPLREYAPSTIKKAIAQRGNAEKADVMRAVNELFLGPPETRIVDEDESDALAVAVTYLNEVEGVTMMERLAARRAT